MTITSTRSRDWTADLADTARANLTAYSRDAGECRDLGMMLGLIEVDPDGSLVAANPWDADLGDPAWHVPNR
ncbi:hypothetical protein L3Q67_26625 [Saccharothrix sp. AJ9571]|nr:hypothetical protein L3Q67_26625 [Saccharothrix sp. AJ9571]